MEAGLVEMKCGGQGGASNGHHRHYIPSCPSIAQNLTIHVYIYLQDITKSKSGFARPIVYDYIHW
jgi:hypothetical protein